MLISSHMDIAQLRNRVDSYGYMPCEELISIRDALVAFHDGRDTAEISEAEWFRIIENAIAVSNNLTAEEIAIDEGIAAEADRSRA